MLAIGGVEDRRRRKNRLSRVLRTLQCGIVVYFKSINQHPPQPITKYLRANMSPLSISRRSKIGAPLFSPAFGRAVYGAGMVLVFMLTNGCNKHAAADAPVPVPQNISPDRPLSSPAPDAIRTPKVVAVSVAAEPDNSAMLDKLTQVLRRFSVEHRKVPQALSELVAAGYLTAIPAVPAGKQFSIDKKTLQVVLSNR